MGGYTSSLSGFPEEVFACANTSAVCRYVYLSTSGTAIEMQHCCWLVGPTWMLFMDGKLTLVLCCPYPAGSMRYPMNSRVLMRKLSTQFEGMKPLDGF